MASEQNRANTLDFLSQKLPLVLKCQEVKTRTLENTEKSQNLKFIIPVIDNKGLFYAEKN